MTATARAKAMAGRHWPLALVVLVAAAFRFINLFPTFLYGDAAEYATVARSLTAHPLGLEYPDLESYGPSPFVSQPPLLLYLFAVAGWLFGSVETGAIVASALLGTATVGLVYALVQPWAGRLAAFLGALFLAVVPLHVNLSRKAMLDPGLAFFFTLTLVLFLHWHRTRTTRAAVLTGVAAAATCLSKLPGFLVLLPLGIGLGVAWWSMRGRRLERARLWRHALWAFLPILAVGFLYLALLWYLHALQDLADKLVWQSSRVAGVQETNPLQTNRGKPWHWYVTAPGQGLWSQLGPPLLVLAVLGMALYRRWDRSPQTRFALTVLGAATAAVVLFFFASHRKQAFYILPLLPLMCAWAALPAARLLRGAWDRFPVPTGPVSAGAPMAVAVVGLTFFAGLPTLQSTTAEVFRPDSYGDGIPQAALWIHARDPEAAQVGTLLGRFGLFFYNGQTTYHWYTPHGFVEEEVRRGHVRFVVLDTYFNASAERSWMEGLARDHGGELVFVHPPGSPEPRVRLYQLHPEPLSRESATA